MGTIFGGFASRFVSGLRHRLPRLARLLPVPRRADGRLGARGGPAAAARGAISARFAGLRTTARQLPRPPDQPAPAGDLRGRVFACCSRSSPLSPSPISCSPHRPTASARPALGSIFAVYLFGVVSTPVATKLALRIGRLPTLAMAAAMAVGGLLLTLLPSLGAIIGRAGDAGGRGVRRAVAHHRLHRRRGAASQIHRRRALRHLSYYVGGSLGGILPAGHLALGGLAGLCGALRPPCRSLMLAIALVFWRDPPAGEPGLP